MTFWCSWVSSHISPKHAGLWLICDLYELERLKAYGRSDVRLGGNQKLNCLGAVERLLCYIFYVICMCVCVLGEMPPREGNLKKKSFKKWAVFIVALNFKVWSAKSRCCKLKWKLAWGQKNWRRRYLIVKRKNAFWNQNTLYT